MKPKRILLVEDEGIVALDLKESLVHLGYDVVSTVSSGEDAVSVAEETKPDLVLMDIFLQGKMDGIEAASLIRMRHQIPIIYVTAYTDPKTFDRAKKTEPSGFIVKPFRETELRTCLELTFYKNQLNRVVEKRKEWFLNLLNTIGDAVIATDSKNLVTFMNPAAFALTGYDDKAIGKPFFSICPLFTIESQKPLEADFFKKPESLQDGLWEGTLTSRDGNKKIVQIRPTSMLGNEIETPGTVLILRDVTREKKMEEEVFQARNLKSVGVLAGGIAHDFNNLLTSIIGNIHLSRMNFENKTSLVQHLENMENASNQARTLAGQLLAFAVGDEPEKRVTAVEKLVTDSVRFSLSGSDIRPDFFVGNTLSPVDCDEGQISRVISNIIINAKESMSNSGTIQVAIEEVSSPNDDAPTLREGRYIKISIKDQGPGIPSEIKEKIFEPYFTTKKMGSGFGLAVSHSIINKHQGAIQVDSKVYEGTTVIVYLPVSPQKPDLEKTIPPQAQVVEAKILVLDDDEHIRKFLKEFLSVSGFAVETASEGKTAVLLYKKAMDAGTPFTVAILDLTIPGGMGGKEVIKHILEIDPKVKAIVTSGYSRDCVLAEYKDFGFTAALKKPFHPEQILKLLSEC